MEYCLQKYNLILFDFPLLLVKTQSFVIHSTGNLFLCKCNNFNTSLHSFIFWEIEHRGKIDNEQQWLKFHY